MAQRRSFKNCTADSLIGAKVSKANSWNAYDPIIINLIIINIIGKKLTNRYDTQSAQTNAGKQSYSVEALQQHRDSLEEKTCLSSLAWAGGNSMTQTAKELAGWRAEDGQRFHRNGLEDVVIIKIIIIILRAKLWRSVL